MEYVGFIIFATFALGKGNPDEIFILYTDFGRRTVGTMNLDGTHIADCLPMGTFGQPEGIAYDPDNNMVYIVDDVKNPGVGYIYKFPLNGWSEPELMVEVDNPCSLSAIYVGAHGQVFFSEATYQKAIYRIDKDGSGFTKLISNAAAVHGVVVDKKNGYLIWAGFVENYIERAPLTDLQSREIILSRFETEAPIGLYIDEFTNKLYWTEWMSGRIGMSNTDGTNQTTVVSIPLEDDHLLYDITGYNGHIYVTSRVATERIVYHILNGQYMEVLRSSTIQPLGITIIKGNVSEKVCHVRCENGGSFIQNNRTCVCAAPWAGKQCDQCTLVCQNGGTLDTTSCKCDCFKHWGGPTCDNCNIACQNGGIPNTTTCSCDCVQQWGGETCDTSLLPPFALNYPQISSAWPRFGPAAGGTWITITGTNLSVDYNATIVIGDKACDMILQNFTTMIGVTKGLLNNETDLIESELQVCRNIVEKRILRCIHTFTYKENPVIDSIFPKETIIAGGTRITVAGDNLDSVAVIMMEITMVLKTLKSITQPNYDETRKIYTSICQVANKSQMHCVTPMLDIPSRFIDNPVESTHTKRDIHPDANLQNNIRVKHLGIQNYLPFLISRRVKRETVKLEFSEEGDVLEFYVGFQLDGIHKYANYSNIYIYTEPLFDFATEVRIFRAGQRLSFYGEGLDKGVTVNDYAITIGTESCVKLELLTNSLSCYPPQSKPELREDDGDIKDPKIFIQVGLNIQHLAGYLRYSKSAHDGTGLKLPLHIIIPAIGVPAIVIIILIAAMCANKRRGCRQKQG